MQYIKFAFTRFLLVSVFFASVVPYGLAFDRLLQPFAVRNLNPFIGVYGIAAMHSPEVVAPRQHGFNIVVDAASHFTDARNQSESVRIDGETYRLAFRFSRGLTNDWEAGIEVPVVSHSGGFMDGFINQWHDTFGLPTLGRDRVENNQLAFSYVRNDRSLVSVHSSSTGLGDILLFAGKTLKSAEDFAVTMRAQLKLPSGDADRLLGSGGTDFSVSAMASQRWGKAWMGALQIGAGYLETGDVLPELQKNWVGFGTAYIGWRTFRSFALKLQLDVHSSVYENSNIDQLTDAAYQLTVGGSVKAGRSTNIDFGVVEDEINPDISSDIGFQLRIRTLY